MKALLPLVLITGSVLLIEQMGWFKHVEGAIVDTLSRGMTREVPKDIVIVEITDDDYKNFFGQQSPLDPNTVIQLIKSVEQLRPKMIGVDLDTQDDSWAKAADLPSLDPLMSHIVWAGVPKDPVENPSGPPKPEPLHLMPILGRDVSPEQQHVGVVRFPMSPDGFVRTFRCFYPIAIKDRLREMPAFFHLVAQGSDSHRPDPGEGEGENPYLKFSGNRYDFQKVQASELIEVDQKAKMNAVTEPDQHYLDTSQNNARIKQRLRANKRIEPDEQHPSTSTSAKDDARVQMKHIPEELASSFGSPIVLIGGTYGMARDEYLTPLGRMAGVELLANAIETEKHRGIRASTPWRLIPLDIVMGSLIVFIYFLLPGKPGAAMFWSLLTTFVVVPLIGLISFYGTAVFLNLAPIMFGMVMHQMYDGTKEALKLQREVAEKEGVIKKLQAQLQAAGRPSDDVHLPHSEATAGVPSDPASVPRTSVVETGGEELHVQDGPEVSQRGRGHAAGS